MPLIGDVLVDRYRLDGHLGAGGMAVVYRAFDLRLRREVALKLLLPNLARDRAVAQRFEREARILAAVADPAIVTVYDVDAGDPTIGREPFLVMELCPRGSLADAIAAAPEGHLRPDAVIPMIHDVGRGLESLHRRGIAHRDVKPANVLLTATGAKLGDLGVARTAGLTDLTAPGTAVGTLAYLAPEVLAGHEPTTAADVYALSVTTFEALGGRLPREAVARSEKRGLRPGKLAVVDPALRPFDAPIAAALALEPARRPSAAAFGDSLAGALGTWRRQTGTAAPAAVRGDATTRALAVGSRERRDRRRSIIPLVALGVVAVALGGALALASVFGLFASVPGASSPSPPSSASPVGSSAPPSDGSTPTPSASPSASATASVLPTESASPTVALPTPPPVTAPPPVTPAPTPTLRPTLPPFFDPVQSRQDLENVRTAVGNAVTLGVLGSGDAATLLAQADIVDQALTAGDRSAAGTAAARLLSDVQQLIAAGRLHGGGELQHWAQELSQQLPEPP